MLRTLLNLRARRRAEDARVDAFLLAIRCTAPGVVPAPAPVVRYDFRRVLAAA
jgi:hypothetical protein